MAQVTLPNTLTNGTDVDADEVQENLEALRDGVNNIERDQIAQGEIHAGLIENGAVTKAKIGTGAVDTEKLDAEAVTNAKIADATITAAKFDPTVQVYKHAEAPFDIPIAGTKVYSFAGFDMSVMPQITIYYETVLGAQWDIVDKDYPTLTTRLDKSATWDVTVVNATGAIATVIVVCSGLAA